MRRRPAPTFLTERCGGILMRQRQDAARSGIIRALTPTRTFVLALLRRPRSHTVRIFFVALAPGISPSGRAPFRAVRCPFYFFNSLNETFPPCFAFWRACCVFLYTRVSGVAGGLGAALSTNFLQVPQRSKNKKSASRKTERCVYTLVHPQSSVYQRTVAHAL